MWFSLLAVEALKPKLPLSFNRACISLLILALSLLSESPPPPRQQGRVTHV